MKNILRQIFIMGVAVIMCLGLFSACANDYEYKETDFKLTISVDKDEASVGDTVVVTVKFENLSGRDIPIKLTPWDTREKHEIKDLIMIGAYSESDDYSFDVPSLGGKTGKKTIKKDAIFQRTMEFSIEKQSDYEVTSAIFFYAGKDYVPVSVFSETKTIKVI